MFEILRLRIALFFFQFKITNKIGLLFLTQEESKEIYHQLIEILFEREKR